MSFRRGHALLIGVGSYAHMPKANVPISATDAKAVKKVLCDPDVCGYPPQQVALLHDQGATDIKVLGGGIIPDDDIPRLKEAGVLEIFTPGTPLPEIVSFVRQHVPLRALDGSDEQRD